MRNGTPSNFEYKGWGVSVKRSGFQGAYEAVALRNGHKPIVSEEFHCNGAKAMAAKSIRRLIDDAPPQEGTP